MEVIRREEGRKGLGDGGGVEISHHLHHLITVLDEGIKS